MYNQTLYQRRPQSRIGNKKEEPQASIGAREPRTGDPGSPVLVHLSWDHLAGSLGGIIGNFEGGKPMRSSCGITGRDHWFL